MTASDRNALPAYRTITLPASHPGAQLVAIDLPDGGIVGLGVHRGVGDGPDRIRRSHAYWTRAYAARETARTRSGEIMAVIRGLGGDAFQSRGIRPKSLAEANRMEQVLLAQALGLRDPYKATRALERDFRVEGNSELYETTGLLLQTVENIESTPEAAIAGAKRLEAASPGPSTTLNRMLAEIRGTPIPADAVVHLPSDATDSRACLGSVLVTPDRDRGHGPVELTLLASFDPEGMEFEDDGSIGFASVTLKLAHDPALWDPAVDEQLYGDKATAAAVEALLKHRGIDAGAGWSESGRQEPDAGDMDVDFGLVEALWPGLVAKASAPTSWKAREAAPSTDDAGPRHAP